MKEPEVTLVLLMAFPPVAVTKCDVLGRLKNSPRNWTLNRSLIGNSRVMFRSVFHIPGMRRMLRPLFAHDVLAASRRQMPVGS